MVKTMDLEAVPLNEDKYFKMIINVKLKYVFLLLLVWSISIWSQIFDFGWLKKILDYRRVRYSNEFIEFDLMSIFVKELAMDVGIAGS